MLAPLLALALASPPVHAVAYAPHFEGDRRPAAVDAQLDQIKALGATHLTLVAQWAQADIHAAEIAPYPGGSEDAEIRRVAASARARGLRLFLFPIVNVQEQGPGQWRGALDPKDRAAWWRAYTRFLLHYARLGEALGVEILSIGSELGSMERDVAAWRALIQAIRAEFSGQLVYSANWDHFQEVTFWGDLDWMGVNAYFPLTKEARPSRAALDGAWWALRQRLSFWADFHKKPFLFTEVGYRSVRGAAARPYHYETGAIVDLEAQASAWASFTRAWAHHPRLGGIVVWIWSEDGPTGYGLRGKPAEGIVRDFFRRPSAPAEPR